MYIVTYYRVNAEDIRLMLWDTAGQEEFDAITKAYYRGKHTEFLPYWGIDLVQVILGHFSTKKTCEFNQVKNLEGFFYPVCLQKTNSYLNSFFPSCKLQALSVIFKVR